MPVSLESIRFNHDPNSATHDAFNIRVDATHEVVVPEWRRGATSQASDSPAAYAIARVGSNQLTIKALFRITDNTGAVLPGISCDVRAVNASWSFNPLGDVQAASFVTNAEGQSGWVTLRLTGHLGTVVRTADITWQWQARIHPASAWQNIGQTHHRIFVVLDLPTAPWQQKPYPNNTQLPWSQVLYLACHWGFGATTRDAAAGRVTAAVYNLGPGFFEYDCPGGGSSHYSSGSTFNCTKFLERLAGGAGNGMYVNCSDCATFTATLANILGCDLWESRMGYSFDLNPLLAIGSSVWQTACGWGSFFYHEVAWKGACTATENVFDACLQVNGNADPSQPPFWGILPRDMLFGPVGTLDYRGRLCPPSGQPNCNPQPGTRQRRSVV